VCHVYPQAIVLKFIRTLSRSVASQIIELCKRRSNIGSGYCGCRQLTWDWRILKYECDRTNGPNLNIIRHRCFLLLVSNSPPVYCTAVFLLLDTTQASSEGVDGVCGVSSAALSLPVCCSRFMLLCRMWMPECSVLDQRANDR